MTDVLAAFIYFGGMAGAWQLKWGFMRSITWPLEFGAALAVWAEKQGKDATPKAPGDTSPDS